jgi:hypothetical protein
MKIIAEDDNWYKQDRVWDYDKQNRTKKQLKFSNTFHQTPSVRACETTVEEQWALRKQDFLSGGSRIIPAVINCNKIQAWDAYDEVTYGSNRDGSAERKDRTGAHGARGRTGARKSEQAPPAEQQRRYRRSKSRRRQIEYQLQGEVLAQKIERRKMLSRKTRLWATLNRIAGLSGSKINTAENTTGRMKPAKPNRSKKDQSSARETRGKDSSTTQHRKWRERAGKQVRANQEQLEKTTGPLWQQISS